MFEVTEVLFKYGQINQTENHFFNTKKECEDFCNENTKFPPEPEEEDFDYYEDFKYHLKRWKEDKNASKDYTKWYIHFYINNEFYKGIITDL